MFPWDPGVSPSERSEVLPDAPPLCARFLPALPHRVPLALPRHSGGARGVWKVLGVLSGYEVCLVPGAGVSPVTLTVGLSRRLNYEPVALDGVTFHEVRWQACAQRRRGSPGGRRSSCRSRQAARERAGCFGSRAALPSPAARRRDPKQGPKAARYADRYAFGSRAPFSLRSPVAKTRPRCAERVSDWGPLSAGPLLPHWARSKLSLRCPKSLAGRCAGPLEAVRLHSRPAAAPPLRAGLPLNPRRYFASWCPNLHTPLALGADNRLAAVS